MTSNAAAHAIRPTIRTTATLSALRRPQRAVVTILTILFVFAMLIAGSGRANAQESGLSVTIAAAGYVPGPDESPIFLADGDTDALAALANATQGNGSHTECSVPPRRGAASEAQDRSEGQTQNERGGAM